MRFIVTVVVFSSLLIGCASTAEKPAKEQAPAPPAQTQPAEAQPAPRVDIPTVPINKVDTPPRFLTGPKPDYTFEMIQNKVEGVVTAQILVSRSGGVKDVVILRHLGHGTDMSTREALMQYKFEPAIKDGKTVAVWIEMSVNFRPMQR